MNNKIKTIQFTSEEIESALIQIGHRLDQLKEIQIKAGKDGDVGRVLSMEDFMKPIKLFRDKLINNL